MPSNCGILHEWVVGCMWPPTTSFWFGLLFRRNPESFNPQLVTSGTTIDATSHLIYSRLVDYDALSGQLVPALATSWAESDDGLSYRFTLREDVKFQHSSRFTPSRSFNADDVLFSFNRIIDKHHPYHGVSRTGYPFFKALVFLNKLKVLKKSMTMKSFFA